MPDIQPLKLKRIRSRGNLTEKAYQRLKDAIIMGQLAPGALLQEQQVTKALSISRTPLREAFNRLAMEGLLESMPNKGVKVTALTEKDVFDLFEARESIETFFLTRAAKSLSQSEFTRLRQNLESAEQAMLQASDQDELDQAQKEYLVADRDMHDQLIRVCGNRVWIRIYFNIRDRIQIVGHQIGRIPGELLSTVQEHYGILDALEAEQWETARTRMLSHIRDSRQKALAALQGVSAQDQAAQG